MTGVRPSPTTGQLDYAAKDAVATLLLHSRLRDRLAVKHLTEVADLEHEVVPAIACLALTGSPCDAERWVALSDEAMARRIALEDEVQTMLGEALGMGLVGARPVNLNSPRQVREAMARLGVDVAGVGEDALTAAAGRHPVIPKLLEYRGAAKKASTYGIDYLTHVNGGTGRIHAGYQQIGAATGRMSCRSPNLQQVPRDRPYRECFRPIPGRTLVKADLSMIEVCVAAELAGDEALIAAIAAGADIHRLTAAALFERPAEDVTRDERAFAKSVVFGTIYGQGVRGLVANARSHGLDLTEARARALQARFARAWPKLTAWRATRLRGHGREIRTASGRLRRLRADAPGTVRVNTPVQGLAADGFKAGLARLWQTRERCPTAAPVLAVHDELVVECDVGEAETVAAWLSECLVDGMRRFVTRVAVRVEATAARDWSGTPLLEGE